MTVGTYAPRVPVADNRYGNVKTQGPNLWAVLHTTEGSETSTSAEILGSILGIPGSRPNGRGGFYGSSYHAIFDTDRIIPAVPDNVVAYSAGGGNARGIHAVFPGRASQTRAQWLDTNSRAMIAQAAAWLVDLADGEGIPLVRLDSRQVSAYMTGACDHHDITLAFRKSTHTDLGENFPWDVLWADVESILTPQQGETPMPRVIKMKGQPGAYIADSVKVHCATATERDAAIRRLGPMVELDEATFRAFGPIVGPGPDGFDAEGVQL